MDIEHQRLKKIVKKSDKPLSLPLNDTAFAVVEGRQAIQHGPYVFYNPMSGDKFKDVKGALHSAVKRAGCPRSPGTCSGTHSPPVSRAAARTS